MGRSAPDPLPIISPCRHHRPPPRDWTHPMSLSATLDRHFALSERAPRSHRSAGRGDDIPDHGLYHSGQPRFWALRACRWPASRRPPVSPPVLPAS
jgi:hypothetical protein